MKYLESPQPWRWILIAMLITLAVVAFWPSPVDQYLQGDLARILKFLHAHGIPAWFNYKFVEAAANVVLFIPFGIVASLAYREKRWWQIGLVGLLTSFFMEIGQLLFLHNRFASPLDLVTNTGGAVIGSLLAVAVLKRSRSLVS